MIYYFLTICKISSAILSLALPSVLKKYFDKNSSIFNISVVINKVNTLGGNPKNDITKIIVEKLNKVLPSLDLK